MAIFGGKMLHFIKAEQSAHNSVIYTDDTGKHFRYINGTWTWRNHNSGNLVPGDISRKNGQIGKAGGFAVFPDKETGHRALLDCLKTTYGDKNIDELTEKYAPPKENNTAAYIKFLRKKTGVTDDKKIKDFTPEEFQKLWQAIEQMEGYKEGTITEIYTITHVQQNKKHINSNYYIELFGWITQKTCIDLAKQLKLDVDVCVSKLNNTYIRARHGSSIQKNLSELVIKKHDETPV